MLIILQRISDQRDCNTEITPVADLRGEGVGGRAVFLLAQNFFQLKGISPPPIGSYFFQKATIFCVKGIYFVVRICDNEDGASPPPFSNKIFGFATTDSIGLHNKQQNMHLTKRGRVWGIFMEGFRVLWVNHLVCGFRGDFHRFFRRYGGFDSIPTAALVFLFTKHGLLCFLWSAICPVFIRDGFAVVTVRRIWETWTRRAKSGRWSLATWLWHRYAELCGQERLASSGNELSGNFTVYRLWST